MLLFVLLDLVRLLADVGEVLVGDASARAVVWRVGTVLRVLGRLGDASRIVGCGTHLELRWHSQPPRLHLVLRIYFLLLFAAPVDGFPLQLAPEILQIVQELQIGVVLQIFVCDAFLFALHFFLNVSHLILKIHLLVLRLLHFLLSAFEIKLFEELVVLGLLSILRRLLPSPGRS